MRDDKKVTGISLHSLMDKVKNMDSDKQAFGRVKVKLNEFKKEGIFKGIELDSDEEEDDETVNLLNKLVRLIDRTKKEIEKRDKETKEMRETHEKTEQNRKVNDKAEIDDLVDEYNQRDDEFHDINDKYVQLKKDMKKKMYLVAKYKEEMEDAQALADGLKEEYKTKLKDRKAKIIELEDQLKSKDIRIINLQNDMDEYLQRSPSKSDTSTEMDSYALTNERRKVAKLTEEIKKLYDQIDKLNLRLKGENIKNRDNTLERLRNISKERQN